MKKKEIIWRTILEASLEKKRRGEELAFTQKELAQELHCSLSTLFHALKIPRKSGAIRVTGRAFYLRDFEKLLYLWATERNLEKETLYQTRIDQSPLQIESQMPPTIIFGAYSAYRLRFRKAPADYDKVIVYAETADELSKRFPKKKGHANLWVLKADPELQRYGNTTPLSQTFVDLWNLPDWFAKEYLTALKEEFDGFLA
jgi:DNA-binding transcriptional MocR family regulator